MAMNIPSSSSRNSVLIALFSGLVLCCSCSGDEQKRQLAELQKKCDERVSQLDKQSKDQVGGLEKQIEALKLEATESAAKAKSEVDEAVAKAQASVDDAEKEATAALKKARDAYRAEAKSRYATLNKEVAEVTSKAQKIPAKGKAAYDKAIQGVLNLQKEITKDLAAYDKATLDTLGKTKAKMDVDLAKYKAAIKTARSKVPA
jgi:ABC-type phosphate transport system auxiliary subunit